MEAYPTPSPPGVQGAERPCPARAGFVRRLPPFSHCKLRCATYLGSGTNRRATKGDGSGRDVTMKFFRKLGNPFALAIEGFLAAALVFVVANPVVLHPGAGASAESQAIYSELTR